jgi:uncharacterized protein (TIGR03086 family)
MLTTSAAGLLAFDALAVRASAGLAAQASAADLGRPTPCDGWTLRDLLEHMTAQHYGFAAASAGEGGDLEHWRARPLGGDPVGAYLAAAGHVLASFADDGVLDRTFILPEFTRGHAFPGPQAVSFHFIDYVVHSWDVAKTLDLPVRFDPVLLEAALGVARNVPDDGARLQPGTPFAPGVAWAGEPGLDQVVALLGRSPDWQRP